MTCDLDTQTRHIAAGTATRPRQCARRFLQAGTWQSPHSSEIYPGSSLGGAAQRQAGDIRFPPVRPSLLAGPAETECLVECDSEQTPGAPATCAQWPLWPSAHPSYAAGTVLRLERRRPRQAALDRGAWPAPRWVEAPRLSPRATPPGPGFADSQLRNRRSKEIHAGTSA